MPTQLHLVTDRYDDLPPDTRKQIHAVDNAYAKVVTDAAPEFAAHAEIVKAVYSHVNAAHKLFRDAAADQVVYARAVGAQVERLSAKAHVLIAVALFVIAAAETALGFPGLRFALGHRGDIEYPWEDPLGLVAAIGFGLISLKLAESAAREWMGADRGVLHEPAPAEVTADPLVPEVLLDGDGRRLIPQSVLSATTDGPVGDAPPIASADDDAVRLRFEHVVRDSVTRKTRLWRAGTIVAIGVTLWAFNGYMRAQYVGAVDSRSVVSQVSGISIAPQAAARPAGTPAGLELVLIGLGIVFFLGMIFVSSRGQSALAQRAHTLQLNRDQRLRELQAAVKRAQDPIRAFEQQRSIVEYAAANAGNQRGVASAEGTRA